MRSTVALVTGASRGIGAEIARSLAGAGLAVGLVARNREPLEAVRRDCGERALALPADVTDRAAVESVVRRVEAELGPVDLLVNNAGLIEQTEVPVWEADPDDWWRVVEADLRGPFLCCRAVLPGMVERGHGRIVNLTTGIAMQDGPVYSGYAAAKTGLLRLTGSIVAAGADRGIRAFDVAPGTVRTQMTGAMPMHAGRTDWTPVQAVTDIVDAIAAGTADALSGWFIRAGTDDVATLLRAADGGAPAGTRRLAMRPYAAADPLG